MKVPARAIGYVFHKDDWWEVLEEVGKAQFRIALHGRTELVDAKDLMREVPK